MSSRKGKRTPPGPNYLKAAGELIVTKVTPHSFWFDDRWYADNPVGGGKSVSINWYRHFEEEERVDPRCQSFVDAARRIVDALRSQSSGTRRKDYAVFRDKAPLVLEIACWLYRNGYSAFSEITPTAADWFKSDTLSQGPASFDSEGAMGVRDLELNDSEDADEMTVASLAKRLRMLVDIFELRQEFTAFPELCVKEHPLRNERAQAVAEELAIATDGWIPRVPDEVYGPLMGSVLDWMDTYSKDVLFAQNEYIRAIDSRRHHRGKNYAEFTDPVLLKVKFSGGGALACEWRRPFLPSMRRRTEVAQPDDHARGPTSQLRDLIEDLGSAAQIGVHGMTGMRISELLGSKAEARQPNGWPACLSMRQSLSGLYDVFFLVGMLYKGTGDSDGEPAEWILGVRPVGSDSLPIAVRAILVLDDLYRPWRERFQSHYLIVSMGKGGSLPHSPPPTVKPLSDTQRRHQAEFIRRNVRIPAEFRDWVVTSHQYRKTVAQDSVRINDKALPAVQENFKHSSAYITDESYVGTDNSMLRIMDDVASREAARMMVDRIFGKVPLGGKMAAIIDSQEQRIREICEGAETDERRIIALQSAISLDGIKLFTSDYMDCLFRPEHALCHRDLLGRFDPEATHPLQAYRTRKNCSSCSNGLVNKHHLDYWRKHYREHLAIAQANLAPEGDRRIAALASARASQARSVLRKIGEWPIEA